MWGGRLEAATDSYAQRQLRLTLLLLLLPPPLLGFRLVCLGLAAVAAAALLLLLFLCKLRQGCHGGQRRVDKKTGPAE